MIFKLLKKYPQNFLKRSFFIILFIYFSALVVEIFFIFSKKELAYNPRVKFDLSKSSLFFFEPNSKSIYGKEKNYWRYVKKYNFLPISGYPNKEVLFCNEDDGWISYKTDSLGFRNDDNLWKVKNFSFLIGDSFVQGACVKDKDTLSSILTKKGESNYLNLGSSGNNPIHYQRILDIFLKPMLTNNKIPRPKELIIIFYENDFEANILNQTKKLIGNSPINSNYFYSELDKKWKLSKNAENFFKDQIKYGVYKRKSNYISYLNLFLRKLKNTLFLRTTLKQIKGESNMKIDSHVKNYDEALLTVKKAIYYCKELDCKINIVYIPSKSSLKKTKKNSLDSYYEATYFKNNLNILIANKKIINFIDLSKELIYKKEAYQYFAKNGFHFSQIGYEKLANKIKQALKELSN